MSNKSLKERELIVTFLKEFEIHPSGEPYFASAKQAKEVYGKDYEDTDKKFDTAIMRKKLLEQGSKNSQDDILKDERNDDEGKYYQMRHANNRCGDSDDELVAKAAAPFYDKSYQWEPEASESIDRQHCIIIKLQKPAVEASKDIDEKDVFFVNLHTKNSINFTKGIILRKQLVRNEVEDGSEMEKHDIQYIIQFFGIQYMNF